ncbi:uncharacterized protein LTR77_003422 [Saxophila tyrrhenica]|uniref:DDH domain-containing protein n=1 Tax=Saxophila tyrrhenica TaxID=1690608 RepID=A0AAV9PDM5_9PEZI|nr:hypothetical protein LTR77_003422 [Saxophila tyrrhenica]
MKRSNPPTNAEPASKKPRPTVPDYHLTPSVKEQDGSIQWPAPSSQIKIVQEFILECARAKATTLIVPDKDADGLSSGAILQHTLRLLGVPPELIHVHLLTKGNTVHSEPERVKMASHKPQFIFVLDQGSRSGPPLIDGEHKSIIIDHHFANEADFPEGAAFVNACHSPPVATSSLLTYLLCEPLHPGVQERCDWLCVVGTHGDLGNTLKWEPPFPDMKACLKKYTKKTLNDVVSAINAPRRAASYDVVSAWNALCETTDPSSVLKNPRLLEARQEVSAEVERCTHTAPKFSLDGKIAVFRIKSECQVHPVIATRWAGHLSSKLLEVVMVANEGYLEGKVNFSCRIPRSARAREPAVDIIQSLKHYASLKDPLEDESNGTVTSEKAPLIDRLGADFARGHVQASGGIVNVDEFEELMRIMRIGEKAPKKNEDSSPTKKKKPAIDAGQKNSITGYFAKASQK